MQDGSCPVEMITGMPVATAPAGIDVATAERLREVFLEAAARALLQRPAAAVGRSVAG